VTDTLAAALGHGYRVERELGQGGMATVYLAHDLKHDRRVAVKVISWTPRAPIFLPAPGRRYDTPAAHEQSDGH